MWTLLLAKGDVLVAQNETKFVRIVPTLSMKTIVAYGSKGYVRAIFRQGKERSVIDFPCANDETIGTDDPNTRPVAALIKTTPDKLFVALTLQVRSGVYDFRRMTMYLVDRGKHRIEFKKIGAEEFSDFGSWSWTPRDGLLVWDADLRESPHEGPHTYVIRKFELSSRIARTQVFRTTKKYNPGWTEDGQRPAVILSKNDPLREIGLRWRWWGDVKSRREVNLRKAN